MSLELIDFLAILILGVALATLFHILEYLDED